MKHVWILNHYAQVPGGVGGIRHFALARELRKQGWTASVIAASVEHATGRQRLRGLRFRRRSDVSGTTWLWLRTPRYFGNGFLRIFNILIYTLMVLLPGATRGLTRPDVVIGSSVHPLAAWAGARLADRFRVPFVFEVRDLWPATLVDMGRLSPDGLISLALYRLERKLARRAALIIVLLPQAMEYYCALGVEKKRVLVLPNGADVNSHALSSPTSCPSIGRELQDRKSGNFVLMYCGAMGEANSLDTLIDSLKQVESEWKGPVEFACRLIGNGPKRSELECRAQELGLKSVTFESPVPKDQVPRLLEEADAFVITLRHLPRLYRFGVSMNKIFDYMAAGRPTVMAADVPDNPIELSKGGLVVPPESPRELGAAILTLAGTSEPERIAMGERAWRYVRENHDYGSLAKRLADALDWVTEKSGQG